MGGKDKTLKTEFNADQARRILDLYKLNPSDSSISFYWLTHLAGPFSLHRFSNETKGFAEDEHSSERKDQNSNVNLYNENDFSQAATNLKGVKIIKLTLPSGSIEIPSFISEKEFNGEYDPDAELTRMSIAMSTRIESAIFNRLRTDFGSSWGSSKHEVAVSDLLGDFADPAKNAHRRAVTLLVTPRMIATADGDLLKDGEFSHEDLLRVFAKRGAKELIHNKDGLVQADVEKAAAILAKSGIADKDGSLAKGLTYYAQMGVGITNRVAAILNKPDLKEEPSPALQESLSQTQSSTPSSTIN